MTTAERRTAAEPELVFQQTVEGLFRVGLRGKVSRELEARLRDAGLDLSRPLAPAYTREAWNHFLHITVKTLWPGEPPERAFYALGRQLVLGYMETFIGRALTTLLQLMGPRRMLERMTHNFRSGGNYNVSRVTHVGPTEVLYWLNEPRLPPAYVAGILETALSLAGCKNLDLQVHARDAEGCTYRIRWDR